MSKPIVTGPASLVPEAGEPRITARSSSDALVSYLSGEGFEPRYPPAFEPLPVVEADDEIPGPLTQAARTAKAAFARDSNHAFASRLSLRTKGADAQIYNTARIHYWSSQT